MGGTVQLLGQDVGLINNALINVSGNAGGGTILVGGSLHGQGSTLTASRTYVAAGVVLEADALR